MSRYQAVWEPNSKNEPFWREVLVGRRITDIHFETGTDRLCAFVLDDGQKVTLISNEHGAVIGIED